MAVGHLLADIKASKAGVSLARTQRVAPWAGHMVSTPLSGSSTDTQPVTENPVNVTGYDQPMFAMSDWYNRIHIMPTDVDLGFVLTDLTYNVTVWNAYLTPKVLTSITETNGDGITITLPGANPFTFEPLRERTYAFNIAAEGTSVIGAEYTFNFTAAPAPLVTFTGLRLMLFPFRPNWKDGISEALEWRTDVMTAYDGTEQRRSLRVKPRRGFEYDFMVKDENARLFETIMWIWQHREFGVPVWTDKVTLSAGAIADDTSIAVSSTDDLSFWVGGLLVLYAGPDNFEVTEALTVGANVIGLKYPIKNNWPANTRVHPVMIAHGLPSVPTQRLTDSLITGRVSFVGSADVNDTNLPNTDAPVTYDGKEVFTSKINWRDAITNNFLHEFDTIDAGVGKLRWKTSEIKGRISRPCIVQLRSRSAISGFRAFLGRVRGQAKAFWMPSWHDDMTVTAITNIGGSTLQVAGETFADYVGVDTSRDRLAIVMHSGTTFYRKINSLSIVDGDTIFQLDSAFTEQVSPASVKRIHFLLHCRLASDKVEIPWKTDAIVELQITVTTVPL